MQKKSFIKFKKSYILILFISLIVFTLITLSMYFFESSFAGIEGSINQNIQSLYGGTTPDFDNGFFNGVLAFFTTVGAPSSVVIITIVISVILFFQKHNLLSLWMLAVVSSGGLTGVIFKNIIERERPEGHLSVDVGFSYPSGHSTASSLLILIVLLVFIPNIKKLYLRYSAFTVISIIWFMILYSRIYFNAHYLSDVIGGAFFSLFYVLTAMYIYTWSAEWFRNNIFKRSKV